VNYPAGFVGATGHRPRNFQVQAASERTKGERKGARIERRFASRLSEPFGEDFGIEFGEPFFQRVKALRKLLIAPGMELKFHGHDIPIDIGVHRVEPQLDGVARR
jgi:hypothetical protein